MKIKKKITKRKNPKNKSQDCYAFQDIRFYLSNVFGHDDADYIGGRKSYTQMQSLVLALQMISEPNGKLLDYQKELLTPRIIKTIEELAESLRKQVITVSFRNGIDSFQGLPLNHLDRT